MTDIDKPGAGVSPYRWVVLAVFMLITLAVEIQWLAHAPVARAAEVFYTGQYRAGSLINIDFLAMLYMLVYLVVCIPASYIIDTRGIRVGLSFGALLAGVAGLAKGIGAASFPVVLAAQIGLAVAQPFILNAVTAVTVRWFPLRERGLAAGLSALAQYLGIILAMGVTPLFVVTAPEAANYGAGLERILLYYGIFTAAAALALLLFLRERPSTPLSPSSEGAVRPVPFSRGLRQVFRNRDMLLTLGLFFIGLGIFNAVSAMVDSIAGFLGVTDSDGLLGVVMLAGGVLGALLLPALSDRWRRRKAVLVLCMAGMFAGLLLLTLSGRIAADPEGVYRWALAGSFILGFFVMSAGPVGFQYAAEVGAPTPESTSQGLLLLVGQVSGLLFTAGMSIQENRYLPLFMILFCLLAGAALPGVLLLRESPLMKRGRPPAMAE